MFDVKNLHHAYLIEGDKAKVLSDVNIFLEKELGIVIKGNPDYWQAEFENFSIDDARTLKERAGIKASGKKFFIIAFNFITIEAQNSLLKILEEPTASTHFFFITQSSDHLVSTLKSRLAIINKLSITDDKNLIEAKKFLNASKSDRLKMVKEIIEDIADEEKSKADAITFVNDVELVLYKNFEKTKSVEVMESLQRVIDFKGYLFDRGSSAKLILEYFAVLL
ncbi:MAG: hypothetical protein WCI52_01820 [bacterium]